jgi:stage II sporulation protein R
MGHPSLRAYAYLLFAGVILLMSWESSIASAAVVQQTIPEESIRIRILANSDSVEDQWIKREIRTAIVGQINTWGLAGSDLEQSRAHIRARMPELELLINRLLAQYNYMYAHEIVFGSVAFPSKVYGKEVYPAGNYETLLITLGEGRGENWWCVLFPPLCFGGDTIKARSEQAASEEKQVKSEKAREESKETGNEKEGSLRAKSMKSERESEKTGRADAELVKEGSERAGNEKFGSIKGGHVEQEVEVRFFFADMGKKVGDYLKELF